MIAFFQAFDRKRRGIVDLQEVAIGLCANLKAPIAEKLDCTN